MISLGGSSAEHNLHHREHNRPDAQHPSWVPRPRRARQPHGQWKAGTSRSSLHHLVYPGVPTEVRHLSQQVAIFQGCHECDRLIGHPALLSLSLPDGIQPLIGVFPRSAADGASLPNHASHANPQTSQALHRAPKLGLHHTKQLPRIGSAPAFRCHGSAHLFQSSLFCRTRRKGHSLQFHPSHLLVGSHHHDNRGLRRHDACNPLGKGGGIRLLHLRRTSHCTAYSHHSQQLCRILQDSSATRKGLEAAWDHGESTAIREPDSQGRRQPPRQFSQKFGNGGDDPRTRYQCV